MKLFQVIILFFFLLLVASLITEAKNEKAKDRNKRHIFRYLQRRIKNVGCRIKHWRTVLDRNGRMTGCVPYCSRGYTDRVSLEFGHYCRPQVQRFLGGCANRWCSRCQKNWYKTQSYDIKKRCVESCPSGTYVDAARNRCTLCTYSFCNACSSKTNCTQCASPRVLLTDSQGNGQCVLSCPTKFVRRFDRLRRTLVCTKKDEPGEETVAEGCADRFCIACKQGYLRLRSTGSKLKCVRECPEGHAVSGSNCRACNEPRCSKCSNKSLALCYECKRGYALLARSPFLNECARECPPTHVLITNNGTVAARCELKPPRVCTIKYCAECLHSDLDAFHVGCSRCKDKFYLKRDAFSDRCLSKCPLGFYGAVRPGSKVKSCFECEAPFCQSCVTASKCLACLPPFVLEKETGACKLCHLPEVYDAEAKACRHGGSVFNPTTTPPPPVFKIE